MVRLKGLRSGFTLVELLVVIGIVGLLIALLMPVLARAREGARIATCSSNLRQWAMAAHMYANENHNYLPRRGYGWVPNALPTDAQNQYDWFNALPPMIGLTPYGEVALRGQIPRPSNPSIWICPDAIDSTGKKNFFGYAMNMGLSVWEVPLPELMSGVGGSDSMVFMTDSLGPNCSVWPSAQPRTYNPAIRHAGRANVAFLDGHVASLLATEIGQGIGPVETDEVRWRVPGSIWPGPPF